ncbi:protein-lysine N-methyltransferase EEF2KMT [Hyalella azteca]|uniref:Protein-lysine N-methyltransferase EEF2KMT n=1 Tax=Hyalella azteca TaxID=294128 RepID=A0A8B7MYS3_HYAAZ|nr:protein-lysine N-methyltransferase EEF2KMT [Hyalella azteca]
MSESDLFNTKQFKQKFLAMYPIEDISFKESFAAEKSYVECQELQKLLIEGTVLSDIAKRYPPKASYVKAFLKSLISEIEVQGHEVSESIYTLYTNLLGEEKESPCCLESTFCGGNSGGFYRTYTLESGKHVTLRETSNLVVDGTTGLRTWQASHVLLEFLLENPSIVQCKRVVELGAGLGLLGLGLIIEHLPAAYTFTDHHPAVMDALHHNICINIAQCQHQDGKTWEYEDCIVRLVPLDWQSTTAADVAACDVVLAADVVFDPRLFPALRHTLSILLDAPGDLQSTPPCDAVAESISSSNVVKSGLMNGNLSSASSLQSSSSMQPSLSPPSPLPLSSQASSLQPSLSMQPQQSLSPPTSPFSSHSVGARRAALLAATVRNEDNINSFVKCLEDASLEVVEVEVRCYREAPSRPLHSVKIFRITPPDPSTLSRSSE